jgi:di/tricarboxylate transporter
MTAPALVLLGIIALTVLAFAREWLPMAAISLSALALLLAFGLVSPEEALVGFSNEAVITVLLMFWMSEGLVRSGLVAKLGYRIAEMTGTSGRAASLLLLGVAATVSAFVNNTAVVSVFLPVALHLARHYRFSPSKILLPLSWAALFGGCITLFGTSTNILVSSLSPVGPLGVFEFAPFGLVMTVVGLAYTAFVALPYLPSRTILSSLTRQYHLSGYLTELRVPEGSKLVGQTVVAERISERFQLNVLEILRGEEKISANLRALPLQPGDTLLVRGAVEDIISFREQFGLLLLTDVKLSDRDLSDQHTILAELQLTPISDLVGATLREVDFRRRFGCFVLAINRTGEHIRDKVARVPLRPWDLLLVFGPRPRVEALYGEDDFQPLGERDLPLRLTRRWWLSALVVTGVITVSAAGLMPIHKAAILGAALLLVSRGMTLQHAIRATDWSVILMLATFLPLGIAMHNTGLADSIARGLSAVGAEHGAHVMLSVFYLTASLLTAFFSNNGTAVLMVPIGVTAALQLGVDPKPFLMASAFAASCDFMTPVGYQTNAMVYGPGNYRFTDYLKFGAPLNLVFWLLATLLLPVFYPF